MKNIFNHHYHHWKNKVYRNSMLLALALFGLSLGLNHLASDYVDLHAVIYVPDIILDNIQVYKVDEILNYGAMFLVIYVVWFLGRKPQIAPFAIKSVALFIIIRSIFITLTHLGPAPNITPIDQNNLMSQLIMGKDFFFSGHAGLPFMLALIFWKNKQARVISLSVSIIFSIAVLAGHLHYSIDVFSAFFISFSIYHLARYLFFEDYKSSEAANINN
ncbi:MAG: phosphatase PAP2-related protein [bacterium]